MGVATGERTRDSELERAERVTADQQAMEEARARAAEEAGGNGGDPACEDRQKIGPTDEGDDFGGRADDALRRLRAGQQLSFDLGVRPLATGAKPDFATVKVAGSLSIDRNLLYGQDVTVQVVDHFGEVVAEGPATVGYPAFKDHFDKNGGKTVERLHTATLD